MLIPVLLLSLRLIRSWNQTGQKHAGEPDIARNIFPVHTLLLWLLVVATYLDITRRLLLYKLPLIPQKIQSTLSFALCMTSLRFKASFASADAPELLMGLPRISLFLVDESSLVGQARVVFFGIGTIALVTITTHIYQRVTLRKNYKGKVEFWLMTDKY